VIPPFFIRRATLMTGNVGNQPALVRSAASVLGVGSLGTMTRHAGMPLPDPFDCHAAHLEHLHRSLFVLSLVNDSREVSEGPVG